MKHSFSLLCLQGQVRVFDVSAPSVPCVVIIIIRSAASNSVFSHIAVIYVRGMRLSLLHSENLNHLLQVMKDHLLASLLPSLVRLASFMAHGGG